MNSQSTRRPDRRAPWRVKLGNVIYNNDTPAGRAFDLLLTVLILSSVLLVLLESVSGFRAKYGPLLRTLEATFALLFTLEYLLRIVTARHASHYARSFFGVVDLLSILPGYIALLVPGVQAFQVVRALRLLRIFRILKLARYLNEASVITEALRASAAKITVFLATVLTLVLIIGATMYVVEGPKNGYTSIPTSVYWAIVTITTVGYGDIAPKTGLGKLIASATMILGYGILAVPTGIVTVGLTQAHARRAAAQRTCPNCGQVQRDEEAVFCSRCGTPLPPPSP
ncbi:ion transporter [Deinococcus maricopensis]|uniref:Ion transport protein n=1 Tax=Deinococcus maricopensis (strain DSM 21211 / LMG 22137 / NRRL B-23946 / LB-34) TaxID=709986 RepID=E8U9D5_DEIML|nr:ion transporter [Deinococcus maricopensis]ADV67674.1 Ion transport protein [Deinococcus maricopensis DSM 21211]